MADSYTYNKESGLVPTGDYEVKLYEIGISILPSGKRKLSLRFRIRDDIEGQAYGNKCIFEDIWPEKENPNMFNQRRINQLLGTQDVKDGQVFEDIYAIMDFMRGNNCLVAHIIVVFDDYRGEEVNKIAYYKVSKHKPKSLDAEEPKQVKKPEPNGAGVVDDDDLPF